MLSTTLRRLVSISGRAILAIGLTSATVLALAPSAKAADTEGVITVHNEPEQTINSFNATPIRLPSAANISTATKVGVLNVSSNAYDGYIIQVKSSVLGHEGKLYNGTVDVVYSLVMEASTANGATGTSSGPKTVTGSPQTLWTNTGGDVATVTKDLDVKITADFTGKAAGIYHDTLQFSITFPQ